MNAVKLCRRLAVLAGAALLSLQCPAQQQISGNEFLTPQLRAMQNDADRNPATLWVERGRELWGEQCQGCHALADPVLKSAATRYPVLAGSGDDTRLINLEDQINRCRQRSGRRADATEDADTLALSALLHASAAGSPVQVQAPVQDARRAQHWQAALARGAALYTTRIGRLNLACVHCHDGKVGAELRAEVISPAHPTGFPIYRLNWQTLGSIDRRLRACFSGVQAMVPATGSAELRELELFLKVRARGMPLDGPSIRR